MTNVCMLLYWMLATMLPADSGERAYKIYLEGIKTYNKALTSSKKRTYLKAEHLFLEAIDMVPDDTKTLPLRKQKIIWDPKIRFPAKKQFWVTERVTYYPNLYLREVRSRWPPQPLGNAMVLDKNGKSFLKIEVYNKGETAMDQVEVFLIGEGGYRKLKSLRSIQAGAMVQVQWQLEGKAPRLVTIRFRERFGFKPCPMRIKL